MKTTLLWEEYEVVLDFTGIPNAHQGEVCFGFFDDVHGEDIATSWAQCWEYERGVPARVVKHAY